MRRALLLLLIVVALALAVACLAWPAVVAMIETLRGGTGGLASQALSPRRITLLLRGVGVAIAASMLAQLLGGALAVGLCDSRRWAWALTAWVCLITWLAPPYMAAYAWSLPILPSGLPTSAALSSANIGWLATMGRAILCLGCWMAPAAAAALAMGWNAAGRAARDLALQDASRTQATVSAALPALLPWLAVSICLTLILGLTEFSICHLCLVQTLNTEILAALQEVARPGMGFRLAWPLVALVAIPAVAMIALRRTWFDAITDREAMASDAPYAGLGDGAIRASAARRAESKRRAEPAPTAPRFHLVLPLAASLILLLPSALLISHFQDSRAWLRIWAVFPRAWPDGLLVASVSALAALILAIGVFALTTAASSLLRRRLRHSASAISTVVIGLTACGALAPPALVGDAVLAAYSGSPALGSSIAPVCMTNVLRFSFLAIAILQSRRLTAQRQMAALDQADWLSALARVQLPLLRGELLVAGLTVGLLSLFEVSAAQLVAPPGFQSLPITLLNQIHFGRSDDVIALCLTAYAFAGVLVLAVVVRFAGRTAVRDRAAGRDEVE